MTRTHDDHNANPNGDAPPPSPTAQLETESPTHHTGVPADNHLRTDRNTPAQHPNAALRKVLAAGKKQLAGLVLLLVLIGAGAACGAALLWPAQYAARAEILYEISTEKPTGFLREDRSLTTQLVLLRSRKVLGPVAERAGVPIEDFQKQVTVALVDSSEVIRVEVHAGSRESARRRTQAIVDRYMQITPAATASDADHYVRAELTKVQQQRAGARMEADRLRQLQGGGASNASAVAAAEATSQSLADREQDLLGQLDELKVAELGSSRPQLVVPSYALADQVSPRPLFAAATGALAGGVVAACAIAVVARHWTRS